MQSQYCQKEDIISNCDHSKCNYPYFNEKYKYKIRREFRQWSMQKRQMFFETTTQRILLHPDKYDDHSFKIHCFLPWNGSLVPICKQFYCHILKISYNMLESHHHFMWKASQNNVDKIYQCYLPQVIESFNMISMNHHPNLKQPINGNKPRVQSSTSKNSKQQNCNVSNKKTTKKKNNNKNGNEDNKKPKLLLGFLRYQNKNENNDNDKEKENEKKLETKKKENKDELAPLNEFLKNIKSITGRVEGIANDYHQNTIREYEELRDHLFVDKIMSEADVVPGDETVNEPKHWKKVEYMIQVMDEKDSISGRKQYVDHAINNIHDMYDMDFVKLLKQVQQSLYTLQCLLNIDTDDQQPSS